MNNYLATGICSIPHYLPQLVIRPILKSHFMIKSQKTTWIYLYQCFIVNNFHFIDKIRKIFPVILICPDIELPNKTAAMYSRLTPGNFSDGGVTRRMVQILAGGQFVGDSVGGLIQNAFDEVAWLAFPDLSPIRQELEQLAPGRFHLSGAGPALFALPASESDRQAVADALQPYAVGVYLVNTVTPGSY